MFYTTDDGTIFNRDGKVIDFSESRFVRDICEGDCCFICGAQPHTKQFTKEHVFPDWILQRYNLYDHRIMMPNGTLLFYREYTVPCCFDCNQLMNEEFEKPISALVNEGPASVRRCLSSNTRGISLLFRWLALIFFKIQLKDKFLRLNRDRRAPDESMAKGVIWEELHSIHALARSFYTGSRLTSGLFGSLLLIPAFTDTPEAAFDFGKLLSQQTFYIKLGDIALIAVFNDSGYAYLKETFDRIDRPVGSMQLRQISIDLAFQNGRLKNRPRLGIYYDLVNEIHELVADVPPMELVPPDLQMRGALMWQCLMQDVSVASDSPKEDELWIKSGKACFLFDSDGRMRPEPRSFKRPKKSGPFIPALRCRSTRDRREGDCYPKAVTATLQTTPYLPH